jgi:archaellum component FlaF (FlaF/FlaG flagellin family)
MLEQMIRTIFTLAVTLFISGNIFTGCVYPAQKTEKVYEKVSDIKENTKSGVNQASRVADAEYQQFNTELDNRITAFEKSVAELQEKYATNNNGRKEFFVTKLAVLEERKSNK